jgi:hypothetical protein
MGRILTPALLAQRMHACQDRWESPPDEPDDDNDPQTGMDDAIALIGRAERALITNRRAAADLLREAAELLQAVADEVAE